MRFFQDVVRHRVRPFYWHPDLVERGQSPFPDLPELERSVANGDDQPLIRHSSVALGKRKVHPTADLLAALNKCVPQAGNVDCPIMLTSSSPVHSDNKDNEVCIAGF